MTRRVIMRPATFTRTGSASSAALSFSPYSACSSPAITLRLKSLGKATPARRSSASLARRSAICSFSSIGWSEDIGSDPRLQARLDELVEGAVPHRLRIAGLDAGAQVLHARLVEDIGTDLVPPLDVGLGRLELLLLLEALLHLAFVEARLEHGHGGGAVAVLRAVALALHHDVGRQVRDAHGGIGAVDVLAAGAARAVGVNAQVGRVDLDLHILVHLGIGEHGGEGGVAPVAGVERRFAHQAVDAGLGVQVAVGIRAGELGGGAFDRSEEHT